MTQRPNKHVNITYFLLLLKSQDDPDEDADADPEVSVGSMLIDVDSIVFVPWRSV